MQVGDKSEKEATLINHLCYILPTQSRAGNAEAVLRWGGKRTVPAGPDPDAATSRPAGLPDSHVSAPHLRKDVHRRRRCRRARRHHRQQDWAQLLVVVTVAMDNLQLEPQDLPAFLDPLLDYLVDHLPPPLYDALYSLLTYTILLASSAYTFALSLPSWKPWEWDAQRILPPLISILIAYYTILSVFRTTGWMIRMTVRFIKWGAILGLLGMGAGWYLGNNDAQGGLAGALRDAAFGNGNPQNARDRGQHRQRPPPWESFKAHEDWKYDEQEAQRTESGGLLDQFLRNAVGGGIYDFAAGAAQVFQGMANNNPDGAEGQSQRRHKRRAKTAAHKRMRSQR